MGSIFQDAVVATVIVNSDRQMHTQAERDAQAGFAIKFWPGAGIIGDRMLIFEST